MVVTASADVSTLRAPQIRQLLRCSVNGGFTEYVLADRNCLGHVPDGLGWEMAAPVLCSGVTAYKGLKETDINRVTQLSSLVSVGCQQTSTIRD